MATKPAEPRARTLASLALFVLAWLWLSLRPDTPVTGDTSRDLAFARDLADGVELHHHGVWTSFLAFEQGTTWLDLLALFLRLGLTAAGMQMVLTTMLAAAIVASYLGIVRLLDGLGDASAPAVRSRAAIAGALALLASLPVTCEMPILWQPLLLPVPVVFAHLALWRVLADGELVDALALAILCVLAVDVHIVAIVLLAPAIIAVGLASKRPALALAASATVGLGFALLCSPATVRDNYLIAYYHGWLPVAAVAVVVVVVLGPALRRPFAKLSRRRRLELAVGLEALAIAAVVIGALLPNTPELSGRYLAPFAPGLALALALLATRWQGSWGSWAAAGVAVVALWSQTRHLRDDGERELPLNPGYEQREIEVVGAALRERGLTWTEAVVSLQAPAHADFLGGLAAMLEPGSEPEPEHGLVLVPLWPDEAKVVVAELPSSAQTFEFDDVTMVLVETSLRLDRRGVSVCGEDGECRPVILAVERREAQAYPNAWVGRNAAIEWMRLHAEGGEPRSVAWRFPVRPGPAATLVLPPNHASECAWEIVDVDGFAREVELPTTVLELPADAEGSLMIGRTLGEDGYRCRRDPEGFIPSPLELDPRWDRLRRAVTQPLFASE